jgi:photosystem II stability/assembly factor-like uncharacterized protein
MDNFELLERLGAVEPPDLVVTARIAAALEGAASQGGSKEGIRRRSSRLRSRPLLLSALAVVVIAVTAVTFLSPGGGLTSPITSAWQSGHSMPIGLGGSTSHSRHGTWVLTDDVLSGTWQQNVSGPPPGYFTCPDSSTCFAMSGSYASDQASAATSESLYASTDFGSTWTDYLMPSGFVSTSPLVCSDATDCAAGGTYNSQPVLVMTSDGGHSFAINPLPAGVGTIYSLSCPSTQFCAGLVAKNADPNMVPEDATLLSTSDGGVHFSNSSIFAGDSMEQIVCSSDLACTTIGASDSLGINDATAGVSAVTTNGGQTWSAGIFPVGFGVNYLSQISCADAQNCSVIGNIEMPIANPPACATIKPSPPKSTPSTPPAQSSAVAAISKLEYRYAMAAFQGADSKSFSCEVGGNGETIISDIASTSDGGRTWTPEQLPSDVPQPQLSGISCPSENECWVSGSAAISQQVGTAYDGGSSVLIGTTNAGTSWSKVIFSVPEGSPNFDGQSFLSAAFISCPTVDDCAANGSGAQGASNAPIYTLRVPNNAT